MKIDNGACPQALAGAAAAPVPPAPAEREQQFKSSLPDTDLRWQGCSAPPPMPLHHYGSRLLRWEEEKRQRTATRGGVEKR
ncbi:unnamed protein product [Urochloa humidicola]